MTKNMPRYFQCSSITLSLVYTVAILHANRAVAQAAPPATIVSVYPAIPNEPLSPTYSITVGGVNSPTYVAPVQAVQTLGLTVGATKYPENDLLGTASITSFDLQGSTVVTIHRILTGAPLLTSAIVLPSSLGINPTILPDQKSISFTVTKPELLTIDFNNDWSNSVQVFVNPLDTPPDHNVSNVIYYVPGSSSNLIPAVVPPNTLLYIGTGAILKLPPTIISSNSTVYIAPGAIVYGIPPTGTPVAPAVPGVNHAVFLLQGNNITLRGRGIIDGSLINTPGMANLVGSSGTNIHIEGVTLRHSYSWHMPVLESQNVTINNVKIIGSEINADGIDIVNSQNVTVSNSFVRVFDDLVVLKTIATVGDGAPTSNINVNNMVLWNQLAHALSLGAEFQQNMHDVTFSDCDIIHDKGRLWLLRVFNSDAGTASNVNFSNIRVEENRALISLWVGYKKPWSKDTTRGNIKDVIFSNIQAPVQYDPNDTNANVDVKGYDSGHEIDGAVFYKVVVGGNGITSSNNNANVANLTFVP